MRIVFKDPMRTVIPLNPPGPRDPEDPDLLGQEVNSIPFSISSPFIQGTEFPSTPNRT